MSESPPTTTTTPVTREAKVVVVGDIGTGRTSLLAALCGKEDSSSASAASAASAATATLQQITLEHYSVETAVGGVPVSLTLWDVPEDARMRPLSYPGTHAFVLLYSVADAASLAHAADAWAAELRAAMGAPLPVPLVLVGAKSDLRRRVPARDARAAAAAMGANAHVEVSVRAREGLAELLETVARLAANVPPLPTLQAPVAAARHGGHNCAVM